MKMEHDQSPSHFEMFFRVGYLYVEDAFLQAF